MTPAALMTARHTPMRLVIFDCDGVLIDSEATVNAIVAEELTRQGWAMSGAESQARFLGMTLIDMVPLIEARLGHSLPPGWREGLATRIVAAMAERAVAVPGARDLLTATTGLGLAWRIASNSSHREMAAKFVRTGLADLTEGRRHSYRDVAAGKPAPDLFLAAAAAEGVVPAACLVVEDSAIGARAARAAGMDCLGFAPHGDGRALAAEGAAIVTALADIPPLLRLALKRAA